MERFADIMATVKFIQNNLEGETAIIIDENKQAILDINRVDQLYDYGIDSNGKSLKKYSPFTVHEKIFKNQIFSYTTLSDEGDFYNGFDTIFKNKQLTIFSRDSKSSELQDKYGSGIFGIAVNNQPILNDIIAKGLNKVIYSL